MEPLDIFTLQSDEIRHNWAWISNFLASVEKRDWEVNDVRLDLMSKKAQLWGIRDGSLVKGIWITKLEDDHGLIWIAAGEGLEQGLKLMAEHTEPWFKEKGCTSIRIIGRRGWERILKDFSFEGVLLEKAI